MTFTEAVDVRTDDNATSLTAVVYESRADGRRPVRA
jgi:hypothetical protein